MHITDVLIIMENTYPKGFDNIIVNVFHMILKGLSVLPINTLEPKPLLKVFVTTFLTDWITVVFQPVLIIPIQ